MRSQRQLLILICAIALIITAIMLFLRGRNDSSVTTIEDLSANNKTVVLISLKQASDHYVQGKYNLCLAELEKIHKIIPNLIIPKQLVKGPLLDLKTLQSFCEQGMQRDEVDVETWKKNRALVDQKVREVVEKCKQNLKLDASIDETRKCLAEATELSPEHPLVIEMLEKAQKRANRR